MGFYMGFQAKSLPIEMVRHFLIHLDTPVAYRRYVILINTNQKRRQSLKIGGISGQSHQEIILAKF